MVDQQRMHKVLRISTDNAFCLHSKERVPFHIVIEVAYDPVANQGTSEEDEERQAETVREKDDGAGILQTPRKKIKQQVEKLKNFMHKSEAKTPSIEMKPIRKANSAKKIYRQMDQTII